MTPFGRKNFLWDALVHDCQEGGLPSCAVLANVFRSKWIPVSFRDRFGRPLQSQHGHIATLFVLGYGIDVGWFHTDGNAKAMVIRIG